MDKLLFGVSISMLAVIQICSATQLTKLTTETKCYGDYDIRYTVLNLSCPVNSVIAISRMKVGAKKKVSNCPENFDKDKHNALCCEKSEDDCIFDFDTSYNDLYHLNCNGQSSCSMQAQHALTFVKCPTEYLDTTSYMYAEYSCIPETNIGQFCLAQETAFDSVLYLWNKEFPGEITAGTTTGCGCSVEVDNCEANIHVYTIQRNLTKESEWTNCQPEQTLFIRDSNLNRALDWTCHDNTLYNTSNTVTSTYLTVNLDNKRKINGGNFWLAFQANKPSNITMYCPPRPQEFCLDTTTTTSGTSATTSITKTTGQSISSLPPPTPLPIVNTTNLNTTNLKTTNTTNPTTDSTTAQTSERTVKATLSTSTEAPTTNMTSSSTPPGSTEESNLWTVIGISSLGGLLILVIVFVLIFRRRYSTKRADERRLNPEPESGPPYAYPYGSNYHEVNSNTAEDARISTSTEIIPRQESGYSADDARISTSTYLTPIHDAGYASVRSTDAHRVTESVKNGDQTIEAHQQKIQPCHGLDLILNKTYP